MFMKKIVTGVLALSLITTLASANGLYVGAGVSIEDIESFGDNGQALELSLGTVFDNNFGVEGKFTKSINSAEGSEGAISAEMDVTTLSIFATYNANLTPDFTLTPKLGFTNFKTDISATDGTLSASVDDTSRGFTFGLDAKYSITPNTKLYIGYTEYDPDFEGTSFDASQIAFGVQQSF